MGPHRQPFSDTGACQKGGQGWDAQSFSNKVSGEPGAGVERESLSLSLFPALPIPNIYQLSLLPLGSFH